MKKSIVATILFVIVIVVCISIYWVSRQNILGNIHYACRKPTSNSSDFTFKGKSGDTLKFVFSSNIENGSLNIMLYDSNGTMVYQLDSAKELITYFTLEKSDTYMLISEYIDFIGDFEIKVIK